MDPDDITDEELDEINASIEEEEHHALRLYREWLSRFPETKQYQDAWITEDGHLHPLSEGMEDALSAAAAVVQHLWTELVQWKAATRGEQYDPPDIHRFDDDLVILDLDQDYPT